MVKTVSGPKRYLSATCCNTHTHTDTHTYTHSSEWDGGDKGWPPRPLLGAHSRLDTQLRAEADQLAWACEQGREGGGRDREKGAPHSKLFQVILLDD